MPSIVARLTSVQKIAFWYEATSRACVRMLTKKRKLTYYVVDRF
ncbi:MAG: hypothetical protein ABSE82_06710 [Nitrososphaerales archaeon]